VIEPGENHYTLVINGKPDGPFTLDELKTRSIQPGDFVKTAGMDDYKEAHEVAELRQLFGFEKQALLQYFGSFDQRATAAVIDWFLVATVCAVPAFIATLFMSDKTALLTVALSLLAVIPIANLIYHIVMESSTRQGTYGKQLLKIRVCDMQGNRITAGHAAKRNLAKVFSVFTVGIGYLMAFFNKQQQCLHDKITATLVVKDRL
jgi:uncharacterized RDD family membrane protein YckC